MVLDEVEGLKRVADGGSGAGPRGSKLVLWTSNNFAVLADTEAIDVLINVLLKKQNKKIKEVCVTNKWAYLSLNAVLDRTRYTRHGLHLNNFG